MRNIFPLADVLEFRRQNAETSGRYKAMSDAELGVEALRQARREAFADAQRAAEEMSQAKQRMDRNLERCASLARQIEAAEALLRARP